MIQEVEKQQKLESTLEKIGLTSNEVKIYISLNKYGDMIIADIQRTSTVPRTSIVRALNRLKEKGLVSESHRDNQIYYISEPPHRLSSIVIEQEADLRAQLDMVSEIKVELDEIVDLFKKDRNIESVKEIDVRYYQGVEGFKNVHERTLDLADEEILFYQNTKRWREAYDIDYDYRHNVPKRVSKGIKNRSLVLTDKLSKELAASSDKYLREVKFLPEDFEFDTTFIIYKDNVAIMISDKPYTAINIKSKVVYKTFKNWFDYLWDHIDMPT